MNEDEQREARKRRWLLIALALSFVVSFSLLVRKALRPLKGNPDVSIEFVRYISNSEIGGDAEFKITNESPWPVFFNSRSRVQIPVGIGATNVADARINHGRLAPGDSRAIVVAAPTGKSRWRVALSAYRDGGAFRAMVIEATGNMRQRGWTDVKDPRRSRSFYSDWIDE
ncbi:MAG: hypothetical protein ACI9VS_004134 [Candidatus Binatia bacterium]|jgi:hypothetical protein